MVVELANKIVEVVGATVDVVGSKVGDSVTEAMDVCMVVVGDSDIVVEGIVVELMVVDGLLVVVGKRVGDAAVAEDEVVVGFEDVDLIVEVLGVSVGVT